MPTASSAQRAPDADAAVIRAELQRVIGSPAMEDADRLVRFLTFVVEETLAGRGTLLKESVVGVNVFGRRADYDPKADPIVRVQARRLRAKLDQHYLTNPTDGLRIVLPKGGYVPEFVRETLPEGASTPAAVSPVNPARSRFIVGFAALVLAAILASVLLLRAGRHHPPSVRLFTAYPNQQSTPVFSPDGMTVAFSWDGNEGDNRDIYLQRLDADSPRRLTTSPAAERMPSWLPDGQNISFLRDEEPGKLAVVVVPVGGGGERTVAEIHASTDEPPPLQWSRDGRSLFTSERGNPGAPGHIVEIEVETGNRRILTNPPPGGQGDDEVALSPDGKQIAFRRASEAAIHSVYVQPVDGGAARLLMQDPSGIKGCTWTRDGRAVIVSARHEGTRRSLWQFPLDGSAPARITDPTEAAYYPAVSPLDGSVAYAVPFLNATIYRVDLVTRSPAKRIIASNLVDTCPHYSPDGRRIAFRSNRTGTDELWVANADGGAPARVTRFGGPVTGNARWSPDGQFLVLDSRPRGNAELYMVASGGGTMRLLTNERSNNVLPSFSGDGKWIYFGSDRTGEWQVWKMPAAGGTALQVTSHGGFMALESPDGRWLYYAKHDVPGLYRMAAAGGPETRILDSLPTSLWGGWGLAGESVVFVNMTGERDSPAQVCVLYPETGKTDIAATLSFAPVRWDGILGVSPDGKYALVSQVERVGSEIHLRPAE